MKVKLIQVTRDPVDVMWTAARTCYSAKSPIETWEYDRYPQVDETEVDRPVNSASYISLEYKEERQEKMWNLVKKVLDSGHQSIAEYTYFTFAIEGISRACSHQLVRHRAGIVFSQQSQRYVEIKENKDQLQNLLIRPASCREQLMQIANKYFVDVNEDNYIGYLECLRSYLNQITNGVKTEDARNILPNATKTNITMSVNYRELIHLCNLRLCTRAQKEIRALFKEIVKEVGKEEPRLAEYLVPTCEKHGFCSEHESCGRKPRLKDIRN